MKDPKDMSAEQINKELESLSKKNGKLADEMIAAGRGHELASETRQKADALSLRCLAVRDRRWDLLHEIKVRTGQQMSKMPTDRLFAGRRTY